jgi:hypothetical protein
LLHADFSKIVLKYSNEVHLLRYFTPLPNDQGIQACVDMFNENNIITPEITQSVIDILSLILNKNYFTFNNEHFLQIHGTAMGSPMARTCANIFMAILERKLLNEAPCTGSYTN